MSKSATNKQHSAPADAAPAAILWLLNGALVPDARLATIATSLGISERRRYEGFLRPQRAREFLLGRMLLRHAAKQMLGVQDVDITITERESNAPLLQLSASHSPSIFYFSLSHSHGWIACVASTDSEVGIDIEDMQHPRDVVALSAASLDQTEMDWLMKQMPEQRKAAFYRLWGFREALYKLAQNREYQDDWNCQVLPHPKLAICLCSAAPLKSIRQSELSAI